jgi:hypothetical protein
MTQPSNPYGRRPGGGISLPDYYRPIEPGGVRTDISGRSFVFTDNPSWRTTRLCRGSTG